MNPYEALANAIIEQAVKDYKIALVKYFKNPRNRSNSSSVIAIERFFRSSWFETLTDADGEFIITKIREMVKMGVA